MGENRTVPSTGFILGSGLYDKLKFVALIFLPAIGTLYFILGNTWDWSNVEKVIGTITAIDTFLGTVIGISSASYKASDAKYDGAIHVITKDDGGKMFSLEVEGDPDEIADKDHLFFKIQNNDPPSD